MTHKLLITTALIAGLVSAPAMAETWGNTNTTDQQGINNKIDIMQTNVRWDTTEIKQYGTDGYIGIEQLNTSDTENHIDQGSETSFKNNAHIRQKNSQNEYVNIQQRGSENIAGVYTNLAGVSASSPLNNNQSRIDQDGQKNSATIHNKASVSSMPTTASIQQKGVEQQAMIIQTQGNNAAITQEGNRYGSAWVEMNGEYNSASTTQAGGDNHAVSRITGQSNSAYIQQINNGTARGHGSSVQTEGTANISNISQKGTNNVYRGMTAGNNNISEVMQAYGSNTLESEIHGSGNRITSTQNGGSSNITSSVNGNNNILQSTQFGNWRNEERTSVSGDGNKVTTMLGARNTDWENTSELAILGNDNLAYITFDGYYSSSYNTQTGDSNKIAQKAIGNNNHFNTNQIGNLNTATFDVQASGNSVSLNQLGAGQTFSMTTK